MHTTVDPRAGVFQGKPTDSPCGAAVVVGSPAESLVREPDIERNIGEW
jgi:hypothetical protein